MRTRLSQNQIIRALSWRSEDPEHRSLRAAAQRFDVPRSTLTRRYQGGKTSRQAQESRFLLSPEEEQVLADAVLGHADRGFPVRIAELKRWSLCILRTRDPFAKPLGRHWTERFLTRHPNIHVRWRQTMDRVRVKAADPKSIEAFYDLLRNTINEYHITPDCMFNLDEKGVALGVLQKARVLARRGTRGFTSQDGNRENVTIIECVCAAGTSLKPLYIFKCQRLQESWVAGDPLGAYYATSPTGWTSNEIGVAYLIKVFDAQTRHLSPKWRLLILDGHASHLSFDFLTFVRENRIIIICFPAHATAMIQPLDVALFSPLSTRWTQVLELELIGGLLMRKQDFCRFYAAARLETFTRGLILKSFEATGIHLFNPNRVDINRTAPPRAHEVGTLPVETPSEVHAIATTDHAELNLEQQATLAALNSALSLVPTGGREAVYAEALKTCHTLLRASVAREIVTADRVRKIEEAAARRKDGTRRILKLGGKVVTSDEVYEEVKRKDEMQRVKEAQKAQRCRMKARGRGREGTRLPALTSRDSESGNETNDDFTGAIPEGEPDSDKLVTRSAPKP